MKKDPFSQLAEWIGTVLLLAVLLNLPFWGYMLYKWFTGDLYI